MKGDQVLTLIILAVIFWLIWRWLNPQETPEERDERLKREERARQEAAEAARKRQEAEAEARRVAEAERARRQEEEEKARQLVEQERASMLALPIPVDIQRAMREFLAAGEFFGEEHSPLAYVGYKVGKTNGLPVRDRQRRLRACFQIEIPKELAGKYQAWGQPVSYRRFTSMCKHLAMLADMRRQRRNFNVAVADWDADAEWFKAECGEVAQRLRNARF
jgi:flagellar biosynthesis GTPase FlhF